MKKLISKRFHEFAESLLHVIYPPLCYHCSEEIETKNRFLCDDCVLQLERINPLGRCPRCFSSDYQLNIKKCHNCKGKQFPYSGMATTFEFLGPVVTIVNKLKYSRYIYLADIMAAYMALQFYTLEWPYPDLIIPVPSPMTKMIHRGFNPSALIAISLGRVIDRQVFPCLKRKRGKFGQEGLILKKSLHSENGSFSLLYPDKIKGKSILLIDDVRKTGQTLIQSGLTLLEGFPSKIYALTFC